MSQQEDGDDFYAAGIRLAEHIAVSSDKDISTATLQALIRDFLPQHEELQEALRSIVARPDFLQLVKLAGSGKGGAQKCALIESLRKIYSTDTVEAADKLVCGIMGLNHKTSSSDLGPNTALDTKAFQEAKVIASEARKKAAYPEEKQIPRARAAERKVHSPLLTSHSFRNIATICLTTLAAVSTIWAANQANNTVKYSPEETPTPKHAENGEPLRIPNDSKVGNQFLAEVIARNAVMQCKGGGGRPAEWNKYWKFLRDKGLDWQDVQGYTYDALTDSALDFLRKQGSCDSNYFDGDLTDRVKKWIL